jgi:hypothetical protein
MARVLLTRAIYADPPSPGHMRAGTWIITTPADRQSPTDVYWPNAPTSGLPTTTVGGPITGAESVSA